MTTVFAAGDDSAVPIPPEIAIVVSEPDDVTVAPVKLSEVCSDPLGVPSSLVATPETTPSKLLPSP